MSEHEAARSHGDAQHEAHPPAAPRPDERPRPRYGEYAPEGWAWQPPVDEHHIEASARAATPGPTAFAAPPAQPVTSADLDGRRDRPVDRLITIILLVVAVFGAWGAIGTLQSLPASLPDALRQAAEMLGTGGAALDYTPGPEVAGIILAGQIVQLVLLALTAWWSVTRLRARRLSFWVPLVGGALSFVALYVVMLIIIMSDPALVATLSGAPA